MASIVVTTYANDANRAEASALSNQVSAETAKLAEEWKPTITDYESFKAHEEAIRAARKMAATVHYDVPGGDTLESYEGDIVNCVSSTITQLGSRGPSTTHAFVSIELPEDRLLTKYKQLVIGALAQRNALHGKAWFCFARYGATEPYVDPSNPPANDSGAVSAPSNASSAQSDWSGIRITAFHGDSTVVEVYTPTDDETRRAREWVHSPVQTFASKNEMEDAAKKASTGMTITIFYDPDVDTPHGYEADIVSCAQMIMNAAKKAGKTSQLVWIQLWDTSKADAGLDTYKCLIVKTLGADWQSLTENIRFYKM